MSLIVNMVLMVFFLSVFLLILAVHRGRCENGPLQCGYRYVVCEYGRTWCGYGYVYPRLFSCSFHLISHDAMYFLLVH